MRRCSAGDGARHGHGARHVAIIMDGNGRWAKQRHLPRAIGHQRGVEAVRTLVRAARATLGLECLTLYAFSSENWKRPEDEISRPDGPDAPVHQIATCREFVANDVRLQDHRRLQGLGARYCRDARRCAGADRATARARWRWRSTTARSRRSPAPRPRPRPKGAITPESDRGRPRHRRPAAARPADPHQRRGAAVELPAVAGGLCRDVVHRRAVARFHARASRRGAGELRAAGSGAMADGESGRRSAGERKTSDLPVRAGFGGGHARGRGRRRCGSAGWCSTRSSSLVALVAFVEFVLLIVQATPQRALPAARRSWRARSTSACRGVSLIAMRGDFAGRADRRRR